MKIGENLHGFNLRRSVPVPDIGATLHEMEHEKCGARLVWLDRPDTNKTFSIAFKTIPQDSTGVFHIIEHSVLCGSAKYPVKEPFVELLKGSLSTFLNALTFNDKTMYPIASRNEKDFLNLVDVYMDAVLHPAILQNPNIFRQEGWHYELSDDGELTTKGVVLNEMRGAYSSVDDLSSEVMTNMLYPDVCYGKDSGGEPSAIVKLTYEQFLAAYKKFYHPSNAYIFLDGAVNLDATLALIDSFLAPYDRLNIDFHIGTQGAIPFTERTVPYEISDTEDPTDKTRLLLGYPTVDYSEQEKAIAIAILIDAIAGSNEAPLKKAMLASGLCEDFSLSNFDGIKQCALIAEIRNCKAENADKLEKLFYDTIRAIVDGGIDKDLLLAAESTLEFSMRERDFGSYPKGLVYAISALGTWLYGGAPELSLAVDPFFASLREKMQGDYFEKLLAELILDQKGYAKLTLAPSATLGAEKREAEKARLAAVKAAMSDAEIAKIREDNENLTKWQKTEDTPEALATIPALAIADVSDKPEEIPTAVGKCGANTVLYHKIATEGITYVSLYFDVSMLDKDDLFRLSVLKTVLTNVATEKRSCIELQNRMKIDLGAFSASIVAAEKDGKTTPYLKVAISVLDTKKAEMIALVEEILLHSVYNDKQTIRNLLKQIRMEGEESLIGGGHAAGLGRVFAMLTEEGAIGEYTGGYESYKMTKALEKSFDSEADALLSAFDTLTRVVFCRDNLTLSYVGGEDPATVESLLSLFPVRGTPAPVSKIPLLPKVSEGIVTPADVSFAIAGDSIGDEMKTRRGNLYVIRNILSYEYLWGAVRVRGGAYGCGFLCRPNGLIAFYSFRDPTAARTLGCYAEASDFLREFEKSGADLTKYIIGSVGESEPLRSPRAMGDAGDLLFLRGMSYADECAFRRAILSTSGKDLLWAAGLVDTMMKSGAISVVGGRDKLVACGDKLSVLREL